MLGWLKKILGKKDETPRESTLGSTHTMGPEELLAPEQVDEETPLEGYEEIASVRSKNPTRFRTRKQDLEEKGEPLEESMEEPPSATKEEALRVMEAALFMTGKGMNVEELGRIANIPLVKARSYIPELVDAFNNRDSSLEIVEDTGGYRMKVKSPFDEKVSTLAGTGELNPAEMKTLAFIAYKQPLLQSQLVQVRSNTAYEHLQVLVEKGFVSREPKGRSYILRTTKKFAEYFGTHALKLKPMNKDEDENPDHTQAEELS